MLEVRQLCKSYGGRQALCPVSFVLPPGQCLGLAGHNGSGKSTLLRLIAQIEKPDGGGVFYEGRSVLGDRNFLRKILGYVPQSPELARELTVRQQLRLWQAACGLSGPFPDVLDLLGLEPLLKSPIRTLSGGMAQRVSIAMALLSQPRVLLMDEAASGLDGGYVPRLLDWLEGVYLPGGGSLIWCSHHSGELERLCGAVLTLENGRMAPM